MAKKTQTTEATEAVETPAPAQKAPPPRPDLDSPSDVISPEMTAELFGERKPVNKPDISRLRDALGPDGFPVFRAGDKIVIERYTSVLAGNPYLDTRTYRVLEIDSVTGNLKLFDDSLQQFAGDNWKVGPKRGNVYKLAGSMNITTKKKRGRPRKAPVEQPKPVELGPDGKPIKKKRGRPPGSKNRPKAEIKAAAAAAVAARGAKAPRARR